MFQAQECFELNELAVVLVAVKSDKALVTDAGKAEVVVDTLKHGNLSAEIHVQVLVIYVISDKLVAHEH